MMLIIAKLIGYIAGCMLAFLYSLLVAITEGNWIFKLNKDDSSNIKYYIRRIKLYVSAM
jgi:hypothetical protein